MTAPTTSALVVLRPARGPLTPDDRIVSENVAGYLPSPAAADAVAGWFRSAGFEVGSPFGMSLSVSGPPSLFRAVFGVDAVPDGAPEREQTGLALPVATLPPEIRDLVEAVEFTPPPAFGPTDY
jgi:hypothetical protein